ncbi:MAG: RNA polymerase sigma factor [Pirellulaceae bacterium]
MTDSPEPGPCDVTDAVVIAARTDSTALGQLFDHFYPLIFAYTVRRLLERAVAEDVTSEVFLKVAVHIPGFSGTRVEDFRRWLFRIATNEIQAHLRQSLRRRVLLEAAARMRAIPAEIAAPLLSSAASLEWEPLYRALGELPEREQAIVSLRFFAGLKHEQIGEVLDITPGHVRVALNRALRKLRERLRDRDVPQPPLPGPWRGK